MKPNQKVYRLKCYYSTHHLTVNVVNLKSITFSWSFSVNLLRSLCLCVPWLFLSNDAMMEQMCSDETQESVS